MRLVERHVNRLIRSVSFISEAHAVLELSNPVRYSSLKDILPIGLKVDVNEYEKMLRARTYLSRRSVLITFRQKIFAWYLSRSKIKYPSICCAEGLTIEQNTFSGTMLNLGPSAKFWNQNRSSKWRRITQLLLIWLMGNKLLPWVNGRENSGKTPAHTSQ